MSAAPPPGPTAVASTLVSPPGGEAGATEIPAREFSLPYLNADSSRPSAASKTYTRNVKGRTYGTLSEVAASGEWPDLIKVIASNGKVGYVKTEEFMPLRKEISDSDLKAFLASTATVWDQDERAPVGEYRQRAGGRRAERATRVVQRLSLIHI